MATDTRDLARRGWQRTAASLPVFSALLFVPAGTLRYWQGWLYGFIFVAASIAIGVYFIRRDPRLVERRMNVGPSAEREPAQKIIMTVALMGFATLIVVPGLDHRWHWSTVPLWLVLAANAGVVLSFALFFLVMKQNSYAASTVTVETGQPVVTTGLYGIVRHPMYAGAMLLVAATPLALGSYWGLLAPMAMAPVLAWRALDKERFLQQNLPGYADYCRRVRYRIVPGIW